MKKRVLISVIAVCVIAALGVTIALLLNRGNKKNPYEEHRATRETNPVQPAGEWSEGIDVTLAYGAYNDKFAIAVKDAQDMWQVLEGDEEKYELITETSGNGPVFVLYSNAIGDSTLKIECDREILTIELSSDGQGVFTIKKVTAEEKVRTNADAYGYDELVKNFRKSGIPEEAEVASIDIEEERAVICLNYDMTTFWYEIGKEWREKTGSDTVVIEIEAGEEIPETETAAGTEEGNAAEEAETTEAETIETGVVINDNGWLKICWEADGMCHELSVPGGAEEQLTALYEILTK